MTLSTEASRSLGPVDLDVQLPRSIKPLHYVVKLQPFINGNFSIVGYMEVEMEVLEPTSNITLHISDIITKNDTVKVSDQATSRGLRIKKHEYDHSRHFYIAHLRKELQKGKRYILSMEFLGYLNDKLRGFYRATYKDVDGNIRNAAATQFQPTAARKAFPCFDEPALKATFEIHLARESWMTTLSNMPIAETVPVEGQEGWMWDRYEKSVPMSTYLVAFVVSDYVHINSTENDRVDFRVWARQETIDQAEYANEIGPKILCFFEDYFNLSYPLPKMDMIALTDFSGGAMENWGLITYSTYNSSVQDDLWKHLTLAAHEDGILPQEVTVKMIMDTWTLQMGYPVVKVTRSPDGTSATLTQERFLLEGSANSSSTTDYKWWVPLTFTTQNEANFSQTQASLWMKDSEDHVTVSSLPRRTSGSSSTCSRRPTTESTTTTTTGILLSTAEEGPPGHLRYKLALDVLLYLRNEGEYLPWATGARKFVYIESMFRRRSGFGALKSVGFDNNIEDSFLEQKKRKIAVKWACRLGHKDCLNKALTLYRHWMSQPDNSSIISPNLKPVVYCRAIAEGGEAEWDFAWDQYVTSSVATEKKLLLRSMSCSKQTWILSRYVVLPVCERGWRVGEAGRVSGKTRSLAKWMGRSRGAALLRSTVTRTVAPRNNEEKRQKKEDATFLGQVVVGYCIEPQVQSFLRRRTVNLEGNQRSVQQAEEKVKNNVAWMDTKYDVIVQWLEENGYSSKLRVV
ncbi:Aminopeptidase N [Penaeus vannamei]|uniref:Aminopeptidase n=1 Tax=Penaeus vannamei TaxID=6689 RepID=A0A423SXV3_PENVA|nr:Aminopeptidase N [Penaeus vannamei]